MLPFLWLVPLGAPFAKAMCCNGFTVQINFEPFDVATICLDGRELTTSYCGVGPCNIFGCNCDGGCRQADWSTCYNNCVTVLQSADNDCRSVCSDTPGAAATSTSTSPDFAK